MNYEKIASQVHQFVKNPQQLLSTKKKTSLTEINDKEIGLLQNATTQYSASGNVMAIDSGILSDWG